MSGVDPADVSSPTPSSPWVAWVRTVLAVALPVALLLTNVRLLGTDVLLRAEYRRAGFPPDPYGLSLDDRIRWAAVARDYLLNDAGIEFLGDLRFADGAPVYNERELRHMEDVKQLVQITLKAWLWSTGIVLAAALGLVAAGRGREARRGLRLGGRLTGIVMVVLIVGLAAAFSVVFVGFHRIFFEGDTWLFLYTDTLIRLFPEQFWRDAFLFVALTTLGEAALILAATRRR
jgi:integral membrane protein (TIGR01906 family)